MKKKLIKLLAIVLTVVLGSVGCSQENKKNTNNKDNIISEYNIQKSDYIHLTMLFPETINPILNKDKSVVYIMNLIYDGLFEIDKDYNVEPRLVEKYSVSSDGKSIKITLNSNAKWHDNNNITSSDISYTIDLIKKTSDSPYVSLVENIQSINILDSKSFTIKLKENDPFILNKLTFPIVSKKNMSGLSTSEMKEYKNNFVGNGPYKIKKYEDRQYIILERNEDYFGDLSENRKEIYVKMVPDKESQTEMVLALDSDIANITLADLSKFEGKKEFNITKYEGRNYEMVMFNYDNEYLDDVNFRKAIISAIDREKLLKEAYVGNVNLSNFPLNTSSKYYNSNIKEIAYDKDESLKYLLSGLKSVNQSMEDKKQAEENKANSEELQGIVEDNSTSSKTTSDFTKKEIKEILPHRYPFLMIDRVEEVEEGKRAKGFKNISINEEFFNGHFPDYPVMPGVLILEALAQMGAICILSKEEFKGKIGFLVGADKVRWKQQVMPGDRLDLEIEITKLRGSIGVGTGYASVDGKVVCQGEIMFAIG